MGDAKRIDVRVIPGKIAIPFVRTHHYSGKVVNNSNLHFGVFYNGVLHGVMSFGPPMDKRKLQGLVAGTGWNDFLELNRMVFDDTLPRNSESRAIAVAMRLIRKNAPQIKWVVSFADGCSCGDGTIYRASGFVLTQIKANCNLCQLPDGTKIHKMTVEGTGASVPRPELGGRTYFDVTGGKFDFKRYVAAAGGKLLPGYQLRYVYFLDPAARERLTVPVIPFSEIDKVGAGMYKGEKVPRADRHAAK